MQAADRPTLLITGGCGKIGSYFARFAADRYQIRIVDKVAWDVARLGPLPGESLVLDLQDPQACQIACEGVDMVIHLAADGDPEADFLSSLLPNNILASYNLFQAALEAGCRRFIYASSVHAVAAYPADVQIRAEMPVRPRNLYGVSKCFGEALAAYYAYAQGMPCIALRIGAYLFPDEMHYLQTHEVDAFLDPDDFNALLIQCLETPEITFAIANAISNNHYKRLDLSTTRATFDYQPQADAFELLGRLPKSGSAG